MWKTNWMLDYSDMTIFLLHPVKGVTAGEGGIITTNGLSVPEIANAWVMEFTKVILISCSRHLKTKAESLVLRNAETWI